METCTGVKDHLLNGNVKILEMIERLNDQDVKAQEKLKFQMQKKQWKEAA